MKAIDLTKELKPYKSGWVALDKNYKVIAHAKTFEEISENMIREKRKDITLFPAAKNYGGFVLLITNP